MQHRPGSEAVSRWRRVVTLDPVCSLLVEAVYLSEISNLDVLHLADNPRGLNTSLIARTPGSIPGPVTFWPHSAGQEELHPDDRLCRVEGA